MQNAEDGRSTKKEEEVEDPQKDAISSSDNEQLIATPGAKDLLALLAASGDDEEKQERESSHIKLGIKDLPPLVQKAPHRSKSAGWRVGPSELAMSESFRNRVWSSIDLRAESLNVKTMEEFQNMNIPGTIIDDSGVPTSAEYFGNYPIIQKLTDWDKENAVVETMLFRDHLRPIDYVLAYEDGTPKEQHRRKLFQKNLMEEGLELEIEDKKDSETGKTFFVKIHAPWDLLCRYAEILKLKKPIKGFIKIRGGQVWKENPFKWTVTDIFGRFGWKNPFMYNEDLIPPEPQVFTAGFTLQRQDMFLIKERDAFFSQAQRNLIVWEILNRVKYSTTDLGFGINRLLKKKTYLSAYPLHDGPYEKDVSGRPKCDRRLLYLEWAHASKWYKKQPLHLVRQYFGDKMALYFAWLGFYTTMLIPASIMGIFTFVCGLFFMNSDYNAPSDAICDHNNAGNITMCPMCDGACNFWNLGDSCLNSKIAFLFDNPMTVVFAIGMSFWATMYLEMWKRRQVVIQWQWDLEHVVDEEELRPEFEEKVQTTKVNPITKQREPYLPFWSKCSRCIAANSLVLMMLMLVMASVLGVIIYRLIVAAVMFRTNDDVFQKNAKLVTSITAASLNLLIIVILNYFYEKVVDYLTAMELPRTESEYEDSFTLKMFLFQFINYYSSLIYIAFFKGRFFYNPGDTSLKGNVFLQLRYDMCDPAGCLFELCVQLAIIMVGKQFISNCVEIFIPVFKVWWKKRNNKEEGQQVYTMWEKDYDLTDYTRYSLFGEYLEMVIQYGFVTLFVAAFPLAPFFALVNNIVEIRLDAYKYLTKTKRPLPQRVQDIGIWLGIMKCITYASVLANALVISYTSDFIPRLVYMYAYSGNFHLEGYITNSLSIFNVSDYEEGMGPDVKRFPKKDWPSVCYYRAYREPPKNSGTGSYDFTIQFWHVFTARLSFIIIFEHVIFIITGLIAWLIPDVPLEVKTQIVMERKVEKDALFEEEMRKIKEERQKLLKMHRIPDADGDKDVFHTPISMSRSTSRSPSRSPTPQ